MTGSTASSLRPHGYPARSQFDPTAGPIRAALRAPVARACDALADRDLAVRARGQRTADLSRVSQLRSEDPAGELLRSAPGAQDRRVAGRGADWHFTFMWIFMGAGAAYLAHQVITGRYRMVLFTPRDVPGVWPMVQHYFFFKAKPPVTEPYNPLQKLAYTSTCCSACCRCSPALPFRHRAVFVALPRDGRLLAGARLALPGDVRIPRVCFRAPGHGGASWLEELRLDADRLEARPGIPGGVVR